MERNTVNQELESQAINDSKTSEIYETYWFEYYHERAINLNFLYDEN